MIPLYLKLTNFMPYHNAELNFSGIHIGCLTGDNGAGKSSILDAITWALWGRSRSKRDDELVHQGQTEMQVEFTFGLGNNVYRVIRGRKVGKKTGVGMLDFQVAMNPLPNPPPFANSANRGGNDLPSPVGAFSDGGRAGDEGRFLPLLLLAILLFPLLLSACSAGPTQPPPGWASTAAARTLAAQGIMPASPQPEMTASIVANS